MNKTYNTKFELFLLEQDTSKMIGGISKVIFITGGPGSGKDCIIRNITETYNILEIPSSRIISYLQGSSDILLQESIKKGIGVIVTSSGDSLSVTRDIKRLFETSGYESMMVHVSVDNETSKSRNENRKKMLSEDVRVKKMDYLNQLKPWHSRLFQNFIEIDNSDKVNLQESLNTTRITEFLSEGVSININGDTTEEVLEVISKLSANTSKDQVSNDPHAFLTLGKRMQVTGEKVDISNVYLTESFQGKVNGILESIDCGIEPGLSMAGSGENLSRPEDKKPRKKEGLELSEDNFGDEITNSISAKKEDELKKVGINIPSVRAKNGSI